MNVLQQSLTVYGSFFPSNADVIRYNLGRYPSGDYFTDGIEIVLGALKSYVEVADIDCSLFVGFICDRNVTVVNQEDNNDGTINDTGQVLAHVEYTPFSDVKPFL